MVQSISHPNFKIFTRYKCYCFFSSKDLMNYSSSTLQVIATYIAQKYSSNAELKKRVPFRPMHITLMRVSS